MSQSSASAPISSAKGANRVMAEEDRWGGGRIGVEFLCHREGRQKGLQAVCLHFFGSFLILAMTGDFAAAWMPSLLVPMVGILGSAVAMALLFNVIEATE